MYSQKKYFWLLLSLFVGCNKENTTETAYDLFGLYESSTFIESGPSDGKIISIIRWLLKHFIER